MAATSSCDWEDTFIAFVFGLEDFIDYYHQTSWARFLENIAVPTCIISAGGNLLFDPSMFPLEKSIKMVVWHLLHGKN